MDCFSVFLSYCLDTSFVINTFWNQVWCLQVCTFSRLLWIFSISCGSRPILELFFPISVKNTIKILIGELPLCLGEDASLIPGLAQWVGDLALLQTAQWVRDSAQIWYCHGCGMSCGCSSYLSPGLGASMCLRCSHEEKKKKKKKKYRHCIQSVCCFEYMDILTILILPIHKHVLSFQLFVYLISFINT